MRDSPFAIINEARTRENIREAFDWFKRQIAKLKNVTPDKLLKDEKRLTGNVKISPKKMYMFKYNPKTK